MHERKGAFAQAQEIATFYLKFENEKSDHEINLVKDLFILLISSFSS